MARPAGLLRAPPLQCSRVSIYARVRPVIAEDRRRQQAEPNDLCTLLVPLVARKSIVLRADDAGGGPAADAADEAALVAEPGARRFTFDGVLGPGASQAETYRLAVAPAVSDALAGCHATVLCFGQTGSGKTHTIFGPDVHAERVTAEDASRLGVLPRAMHDLFERIDARTAAAANGGGGTPPLAFSVSVAYCELYCDTWFDLLPPPPPAAANPPKSRTSRWAPHAGAAGTPAQRGLQAAPRGGGLHRSASVAAPPSGRDAGRRGAGGPTAAAAAAAASAHASSLPVAVASPAACARHPAHSVREVMRLMHAGALRKRVAATAMNDRSSRGHTVFTVSLECCSGGGAMATSSLTFIDLAGSERGSSGGGAASGVHDTHGPYSAGDLAAALVHRSRAAASATLQAEARFINSSLHALGRVLATLGYCALTSARAAAAAADRIRLSRQWGQPAAWGQDALVAADGDASSAAPPQAVVGFVPWRSSKLTHFLQSVMQGGAPCR